MASAQASQHFLARHKAEILDVDADYSTAAVVTSSVKDMRDYSGYVVIAMVSALTGSGMTLLEIVGASNSTGTTDVTSIKTSGAVVGDAVGDYVVLECTAEELAHAGAVAGADLRYAAVRLTLQNANDEVVACIIRTGYKHGPSLNLTANYIS